MGYYGSDNSLVISNGGVVSANNGSSVGYQSHSSSNNFLVKGIGSTWSNWDVNISYGDLTSSNSLTVANLGSVICQNLNIAAFYASSTGTLNIGSFGGSDTAGTIAASSIYIGMGGTINFNQVDTSTMTSPISGNGFINQLGSGTTILTGNNSGYVGITTVSSGTLLANSTTALGTSTVMVTNARTLGGNGTIGGATTIASGGSLTPGSSGAGALSFSAGLTLESGSTTSFLINAPSDFTSINILGNNINFGGELIFNIASYTPAAGDAFTLFNMTGGATQSGGFSSVSAGSMIFAESGGIWNASYGYYAYQFSGSTHGGSSPRAIDLRTPRSRSPDTPDRSVSSEEGRLKNFSD